MADIRLFSTPCNNRTKLLPAAAPPLQMGWLLEAWIQSQHTWETLPQVWVGHLEDKLGKTGCPLAYTAQGEIQLRQA